MQLRHRPFRLRQLHLHAQPNAEPPLLRVILAYPHNKLLLTIQLISPPDALRKLVVRAFLKPMLKHRRRRLSGDHLV